MIVVVVSMRVVVGVVGPFNVGGLGAADHAEFRGFRRRRDHDMVVVYCLWRFYDFYVKKVTVQCFVYLVLSHEIIIPTTKTARLFSSQAVL